MGKANQWCSACQQPVRSLRRHHYRAHGPALNRAAPSTPSIGGQSQLAAPSTLSRGAPCLLDAPKTPAYNPSSPTDDPSSPTDDWLKELTCSVDFPDTVDAEAEPTRPITPKFNPSSPAADDRNAADVKERGRGIATQRDQTTQADGVDDYRSRVTRQLFTHFPHLHVVTPSNLPQVEDHYFTNEKSFADRVEDTRRRRLCDCMSCVNHAIRLTERTVPTEQPAIPGVRFVRLPGLSLHHANTDLQRTIVEFLQQHPEQSYVVCGCITCTLHRNCVKAWQQAQDHANLPPPAVGSCRDRDIKLP